MERLVDLVIGIEDVLETAVLAALADANDLWADVLIGRATLPEVPLTGLSLGPIREAAEFLGPPRKHVMHGHIPG